MTASPSTLIVPVEIQVREMDAKILLSCVAAERGFPVVMGSRAFVHFQADSIQRGVYLAKSMRTLSIRMFAILRELGHDIVAYDEEALVRAPDYEYYRWRLAPETVRSVSHLLAWGEDDARVLKAYAGYAGAPIHITGNPRIDLMRPDVREYYRPQADALRGRFGDFVLVNTNFNKVNHFFAELSDLKHAADAAEGAPAHPFEAGKGRHKLALFLHFLEMIPLLCESLPGYTVLLRPHPAENHGPWLELAGRCRNLRVINEGNVVPWLMAAKALVANSCTTMVESAVLGVPTLNFEPVTSEEYDYRLPNSLSHSATSVAELCEMVGAMVRGELGPIEDSRRRPILQRHLAALDGPIAADRMVDVLVDAGYRDHPPARPPLHAYARGWLRNRIRSAQKRRNMRRPGHRNNIVYHAHRFPDISVAEVRARVACLGRLLQRFENVRVEPYGEHTFSFST
jgi:surface carbohydrate biosynthesis protein